MSYIIKYVHKPINEYEFLSKNYYCTQWHINSPKLLLWLSVLFYSSFVCTCVCVFILIQSPLRECRSIRSGASGLPYYCAPLVCISVVFELLPVCRQNKPKTKKSEVIELLAVWRHNKPKTKNQMVLIESAGWGQPGGPRNVALLPVAISKTVKNSKWEDSSRNFWTKHFPMDFFRWMAHPTHCYTL